MATITDRQMQGKPTAVDQWLIEDGPRGHGRFMARITKKGERFFYFRYANSKGGRVTLPLGAYDPRGAEGLTLAEGRARAGELSKLYQSGIIDIKEHLEAENRLAESQRAAEQARLDAEREANEKAQAAESSRMTVTDLFEKWATVELIRHKDGGQEIRRMFAKDVLPKIGKIAVEDIRKGHITDVTDVLLARGVERMAKLIFSLLRQMFRFAVDRDIIEYDPSSSIRKGKIGGKDTERDRVLSDEEVVALIKQMPSAALLNTTETAVWIALSTCCRIGELLQARWEHVQLDKGEWVIPAENSKNGRSHTVYLSTFARKHFEALLKINGASAWCFPNRDTSDHVCVKTVTKQLVDRQRHDDKPMSRRSPNTTALLLPGGKWTPHDLRRTGATMMVALGILPDVVERCLNHTEENRIKRIYQRHSYQSEMKVAWKTLGERLENLHRLAGTKKLTMLEEFLLAQKS